jgi:hypothetical protein
MDTDVFVQLLEMVKEVSPAVWAMARRQVTVDIVSSGVWTVISAGGAYGLIYVGRRSWLSYKDSLTKTTYGNANDLPAYLCFVFGGILALISVVALNYFLGTLANPDYNTLLKLVNLFMHGA